MSLVKDMPTESDGESVKCDGVAIEIDGSWLSYITELVPASGPGVEFSLFYAIGGPNGPLAPVLHYNRTQCSRGALVGHGGNSITDPHDAGGDLT
jgi:hypothetical protein